MEPSKSLLLVLHKIYNRLLLTIAIQLSFIQQEYISLICLFWLPLAILSLSPFPQTLLDYRIHHYVILFDKTLFWTDVWTKVCWCNVQWCSLVASNLPQMAKVSLFLSEFTYIHKKRLCILWECKFRQKLPRTSFSF